MKQFSIGKYMSYIINADMDPANIKDYVERNIKPYLTQIDYVRDVSVGGAMPLYLDIEYNPIEFSVVIAFNA